MGVPLALLLVSALAAASCAQEPPSADPLQAAIDAATPPNTVGRLGFPDKVIVSNRTQTPLVNCTIEIDGELRSELGALPADTTKTIMRSRFSPYTEADTFYQRGLKPSRLDCLAPNGPVTVHFPASADRQTTVFVPAKQ